MGAKVNDRFPLFQMGITFAVLVGASYHPLPIHGLKGQIIGTILFTNPLTKEVLCWALIIQLLPTHLIILLWSRGELIKMLLGSSLNEFLPFIPASTVSNDNAQ